MAMKYKLRHFENNYQIVSSLGWTLVILGAIFCFVGPFPIGLFFFGVGLLLIWFQLRGKRILVDTENKTVKGLGKEITLKNPQRIYLKEVRMRQNINSRTSSSSVKLYFYKAYIQDGNESILISCNRKASRDLDSLKQIATDLSVPFEQHYS